MSEDLRAARHLAGAPVRIQRKRTKGWRMPEGAIYVGRPTKWGNNTWTEAECGSRAEALRRYVLDFMNDPLRLAFAGLVVTELAGRDLACWCPLDQPCHADVLLDIANTTPTGQEPS
jgi:hypothetical protein